MRICQRILFRRAAKIQKAPERVAKTALFEVLFAGKGVEACKIA